MSMKPFFLFTALAPLASGIPAAVLLAVFNAYGPSPENGIALLFLPASYLFGLIPAAIAAFMLLQAARRFPRLLLSRAQWRLLGAGAGLLGVLGALAVPLLVSAFSGDAGTVLNMVLYMAPFGVVSGAVCSPFFRPAGLVAQVI